MLRTHSICLYVLLSIYPPGRAVGTLFYSVRVFPRRVFSDAMKLRPFYVAIQIIGVIFYLFNVDIQSINLLSPENQAHKYSAEDILGFLQPYFLSIVIIFLKVLLDNLLLVTGNDRNSSLI